MRITIDKNAHFLVSISDGKYVINDSIVDCEVQEIEKGFFRALLNNRVYQGIGEVIDGKIKIQIGHKTFEIETENQGDLLSGIVGISQKSQNRHTSLNAPMPGLIVDVFAKIGQKVKSGQPLLVLKAMKMENIIKAPEDGLITALFIEKGMRIEKDALMIQF